MLTTPDHSDAVTSVPAMEPVGPRPAGFWLDCDPAVGTAGTRFRAEEFNELALNLRRFLAASGVLPVKGAPDMLLSSVNRLFAGKATAIVTSLTLTADHAGLVIIDATAGDITLTLPPANVLPQGSPMFFFVRLDSTTRRVHIAPAAGNVIRDGHIWLGYDAMILRSDGVATWWPIGRMGAPITSAVTLNVSPSGVAAPADPIGGSAFNDLGNALAWLNRRAIVDPGSVTIQIAAGTYTRTSQIMVDHPNAARITVYGAGATTILQFNGCDGVFMTVGLAILAALTIHGDLSPGHRGIAVQSGTVTTLGANLVVDSFGGNGIYIAGVVASSTLLVKNCTAAGIFVAPLGGFGAGAPAQVTLQNNNMTGLDGGQLTGLTSAAITMNQLTTIGGNRGIYLSHCASMMCGPLQITDVVPAAGPYYEAIRVENGAFLGAYNGLLANSWQARSADSVTWYAIFAGDLGTINSHGILHASNVPVCSPPPGGFGNNHAFIQNAVAGGV